MLGYEFPKPSDHPQALATDSKQSLVKVLSGEPAERFKQEVLCPGLTGKHASWNQQDAISKLADPVLCLNDIFHRYAFSRRGKERRALSECACSAVEHTTAGLHDLTDLSAGDIWDAFENECQKVLRKPQPDLNQGVISGLVELSIGIYRECGKSLADFAAHRAESTGRVEETFFSIVELRGVGPKVASTMLRDWIFIFELEDQIVNRDGIYLQPIDRWMRIAAPCILEEPNAGEFPDWILAGKIGKAARQAGASGIRLNMGVSWLGREAAKWGEQDTGFHSLMRSLSQSSDA
jgi:hypothetical protein